eukprot:504145-Amphidinium_carterae.1
MLLKLWLAGEFHLSTLLQADYMRSHRRTGRACCNTAFLARRCRWHMHGRLQSRFVLSLGI